MGYLSDAKRGVFWIGSFRGVTRIISFLKTILLARLLTPSQFGLFGVVVLTLSLLEVVTETGVNTVLIQQKEKADTYINSAWVVSIIRGVLISSVMVLLSLPVANFFKIPESASLITLCALIPIIRGFINPSVVNFQKNLLFKQEFIFRTIVFFVDATVAITLAFMLRSSASLVWGLLAGAVAEVLLSHLFLRPTPKFDFNLKNIRFIINRGKWLTLTGIFDYFIQNGDNIVVGRVLGAVPLGIYQMAYQISSVPVTEISTILSKVTFPVFMKFSNDRKRLFSAYLKTMLVISSITAFISLILIITTPLIQLILGNQWIAVSPVIQVLAIFAFFKSIVLSSYAYFLAIQKQEIVTLIPLFAFIAMFSTILPLINIYGIVGAAISVLIGSLTSLIPVVYYLQKYKNV